MIAVYQIVVVDGIFGCDERVAIRAQIELMIRLDAPRVFGVRTKWGRA